MIDRVLESRVTVLGPSTFHQVPTPYVPIKAVRREPSGAAPPLRLCLRDKHILTPRRKENGDAGIATVLAGPSAIVCQPSALTCPPVNPGGGRRGPIFFYAALFYVPPGHRKRGTV